MEALLVPAEAAGERLDRFLGARLGSRAAAQRRIAAGAVTLDGARARPSDRLRGGERIELVEEQRPPPPAEEPQEPAVAIPIAYEDGDLLVVDKPAGLVVHPAGPHREGTLAQLLAVRGAAGGEPWRPGIVHRLDRDTSGLMVVAKSEEIHRRLRAALAAREIEREYLALVEGRPPARTGTIDAPIGRDRRMRTRRSIDSERPREARTHFAIEEALPRATLLRVRLETGRTHQIRAHLQAIGHPVCGDPEYGSVGLYGLSRQFLHAARLALAHPRDGRALEIVSPLPSDLAAALAAARERRP